MIQKLLEKLKPKPVSNKEAEKAIQTVKKELLTDMFVSTEASDAVETLIRFAQQKINKSGNDMKDMMLESLSSERYEVISVAYLYARQYVRYGEDVTKQWNTATKQTEAMEKAYHVGYAEAMDDMRRRKNESKTS